MNRRFSGGSGGGPRGFTRQSNYSNQQQPFQSGGGMSPWQGGGGNQGGGGTILSQITSNPQQLALALTSLLQPQHQQQQPPSLLSINSNSYSNGRNFGGSGSSVGGRFGGGNALNRGRDFRRHEPYNKNRVGSFNDRRRKFSPKRKGDDKKKFEKKPIKKEENADDDGDEEKKRDWKDEKNSGEAGEEGEEGKDGKYGDIPRKYLNCFVCNKQMWDGESMGKHVRGRAHHEMLKALGESIHVCVNILRENLRLAEERKQIEFNRLNRMRKFSQRREPPQSHCPMCDLHFVGKIISHRRTDGHQRLKRYLHPHCNYCDKEYPSRIEWVEHCLTPEHLKKAHAKIERELGGKNGDEITEGDGEDLELALDPVQEEGDNPILDLGDLEDVPNRFPAYKADRKLALSCLKEFTGWQCELCSRSFANKADSEAHLTTRRHFYRFIDRIREQIEEEEMKKKAEKDAEKSEKTKNGVKKEADEEGGDQEMYDPSETTEEVNGEEEEEEAKDAEQMDTSGAKDGDEEVVEEEEEPVKEAKVPPATPRASARKTGGTAKRGRGGKK